jgi:hypothetical protein|tara:strand:+ start:687 stop:1100 length:414 start_codon:yes stop_codon:yes gene_type:complete
MVIGINMFIYYTLTVEEHSDKIRHTIDNEENPELDGIDEETTADIYTYTPVNSGVLSTKSYTMRKDHAHALTIKDRNEHNFDKEWLIELGFDTNEWTIDQDTREVVHKLRITDQTQIDNWIKPNPTKNLPATDIEEI